MSRGILWVAVFSRATAKITTRQSVFYRRRFPSKACCTRRSHCPYFMCFYNTQRKTHQEYVATLHRHSSKAREGIIAFLSFKSNFIINTVHCTLQRYLSRGLLNFTMQSCNLCDDEIQIRGTKSYNIASIYFLVRITFVREFSSLYCKSHNLSVMFISLLTSVQMKLWKEEFSLV